MLVEDIFDLIHDFGNIDWRDLAPDLGCNHRENLSKWAELVGGKIGQQRLEQLLHVAGETQVLAANVVFHDECSYGVILQLLALEARRMANFH